MIKKLVNCIALVMAITACSNCKEPAKIALAPGMKIVAQWQGDSWWVATIDSIDGNNVTLTYSDGEKGVRDKSQIFPYPKRSNP